MSTLGVFIVCGLLCLCLGAPGVGHGALAGYCDSSLDCDNPNQCCVSLDTYNGPIDLAPGSETIPNGKCVDLGKLDAPCDPEVPSTPIADIYDNVCPCQPSLVCIISPSFPPSSSTSEGRCLLKIHRP